MEPQAEATSTHSSNPLLIGGIGLGVLVVGAASFYFLQKSEPAAISSAVNVATATSTPTATPAVTKITVTEKGALILPGGYADPTVAPTATGYRMYVNSFGNGPSAYVSFTSPNGTTWTKEKGTILAGVATGRAIVLPTGIRFYYPGPQPIKASDAPANMYSSFSTDGVTFTKSTTALIAPRSDAYYMEGPTVFQLPDKTWRMYFNENTIADGNNRHGDIWGASSPDGTTWTRDTAVTLQADGTTEAGTATWKQALHPFVVTNPKGGYVMFYNAHSELYAATSTDGLTWKKIGAIGVHGADADGYFQADGSFRLYYGDFSEKDGGLVYSAVLSIQ